MNFNLIEIDILYPLYFRFIIGIQLLLLIVSFIYCIKLILKILKIKKILHTVRSEIICENELKIVENKLTNQKGKCKFNILVIVFEYLINMVKGISINNSKIEMEKTIMTLKKEIMKNNIGFLIMSYISFFSSMFVTYYESKASIGFEINRILGSFANLVFPVFFVTSIIIAITIFIFYLKNYLYKVLKINVVFSIDHLLNRDRGKQS